MTDAAVAAMDPHEACVASQGCVGPWGTGICPAHAYVGDAGADDADEADEADADAQPGG